MLVVNQQAALATKWNEPPRDALDTMILITGLKLPQVCFVLKREQGNIEFMPWAGGRCVF